MNPWIVEGQQNHPNQLHFHVCSVTTGRSDAIGKNPVQIAQKRMRSAFTVLHHHVVAKGTGRPMRVCFKSPESLRNAARILTLPPSIMLLEETVRLKQGKVDRGGWSWKMAIPSILTSESLMLYSGLYQSSDLHVSNPWTSVSNQVGLLFRLVYWPIMILVTSSQMQQMSWMKYQTVIQMTWPKM